VGLKLVFLGTPEFAVPALEAIAEAGHQIEAVFTQPDRPKGRGQALAASPVKQTAVRLGLPVFQPERVRRAEVVEQLAGIKPDAMIVVGYGQIIPQSIIDIPPLGIINVHASLLPKYRGAAPIQWAIATGETVTGVTTMRIDAGLDTGDMLLEWETAIGPEENALELGARLATAGAALLIETLSALAAGSLTPRPQNNAQATYAPILKKEDGRIDWTWPAQKIFNRARGFLPWPGAYTTFRGQLFHIWRCRPAQSDAPPARRPGQIHVEKRRLYAASGDNTTLELLELQVEGRKRVSAADFLNGIRLSDNEMFGADI
jgi:methionyl-tRNA formyltransferase